MNFFRLIFRIILQGLNDDDMGTFPSTNLVFDPEPVLDPEKVPVPEQVPVPDPVPDPVPEKVPVPDPVPVQERVDLSKTSKCGEVAMCARKMLSVFNNRIAEPVFLYGFQILSNQLQIVFPHHFPVTRRSSVEYPIDGLINPLNLLKLLRNQISIQLVKKLLVLNGNGLCSKFQKMIARAILSRFVQFDTSSSSCIGFLARQTQTTNKVVFSSDGSIVAITCGPIVKICKIDPNGSLVCQHMLTHATNVNYVAFHPSLPYLVTCSYEASICRILDNGTFELVAQLKAGHYESDNAFIPEGNISSACFHPTKPLLVYGSNNWCIYFYEDTGKGWIRTQRIDRTRKSSDRGCYGHHGCVKALKFDASGQTLVSGSSDKTVKCWEISPHTGLLRCVKTIEDHTDHVNNVAFDSDGSYLATVSDDKTVRLYDTETWRCVNIIQTGHSKGVTYCVFHPTNDRIFVTGSDDRTTRIHLLSNDRSSSKVLETLPHHATVKSLAFDPTTPSRLLIGLSMNDEDMHKRTVELYELPK